MEYEVVCIDLVTKKVRVVKTVESKAEALEYIREHGGLCPRGKLKFRRKGYPIVEV